MILLREKIFHSGPVNFPCAGNGRESILGHSRGAESGRDRNEIHYRHPRLNGTGMKFITGTREWTVIPAGIFR